MILKSEVLKMRLKKVTVELEVADVQEILSIDLDDEAERALIFIKEHLVKQVKQNLQSH